MHHGCKCVYGSVPSSPLEQGQKDIPIAIKRNQERTANDSETMGVQFRDESPMAVLSLVNLPVNQARLLYHISSISTQIEICNESDMIIYLKRLPT